MPYILIVSIFGVVVGVILEDAGLGWFAALIATLTICTIAMGGCQ